MEQRLEAMLNASAGGRDLYRPEFFRLSDPADGARLNDLLEREPGMQVHDGLAGQLMELVRCQNPSVRYTPETLAAAGKQHLGTTPAAHYGVWVYYPWSKQLVHLLDEAEFAQVRTDRNRNKITAEEQQRLAKARIGVIGLSVGQSICLALAQERSFGELRIADFDTLELSNLNRIRTGVQDLGINKAVMVAREIAELDPFLKVTLFTAGITTENIHRFFADGGKLDIVVDECDGVDVKIRCRQKAKELGVAVVMDTSDRGLVDVERFDLEPERALLHGFIGHLDPEDAAKARTNEEKLPFLVPMAGLETLSPRMKASMVELGRTIVTWPQLASAVVLGGALAADICRRILLGQFNASGRWWVDMETLVGDRKEGDENAFNAPSMRLELGADEMIRIAAELGNVPTAHLHMTEDQSRKLATAGAMAPSAGNAQPWKFLAQDDRLLLFHDRALSRSALDPSDLIAHLGLGACLENIEVCAASLGLQLSIRLFPVAEELELVADISISGTCEAQTTPADMIPVRHTNRRKGDGRPIASAITEALRATPRDERIKVTLIDSPTDIRGIGAICGAAERIRILNAHGHREFFGHEIRWTTEDAARTGDGLDVNTLELSIADHTGLRVASDGRAMALVAEWGGGTGLEKLAADAITSSPLLALISAPSETLVDRINAGRAAQRIWLTAARSGLAVHPISAPLFLAHHARFDGAVAFTTDEANAVASLFERFQDITGDRALEPMFMIRISHAAEATARSLRRPIDQMLCIHQALPA